MTTEKPEDTEDKKCCPSCGEEYEDDDACECSVCGRDGCSYCMPLKQEHQCPECEEEETL